MTPIEPIDHEADDHFHDECGVFGIFGRADAASAYVRVGVARACGTVAAEAVEEC